MMQRAWILAAGLLCAAYPASASAQASASPPAATKAAQEAVVRKTLYDHGACLVRELRRASERYLATFPFSENAEKAARRLVTPQCPEGADLPLSVEALRGPLYEALYHAEFGNAPVADLEGVAPIDYSVGEGTVDTEARSIQVALRFFADCVVRRNYQPVRALVSTEVASEAEKTAFQPLVPSMSACLPQGTTLKFTRPLLRALFAETLYRLSAAKSGT